MDFSSKPRLSLYWATNISVRIQTFCSQQQCSCCSLPHQWLIWTDFAFSWRKFRTDPNSNRSELIRVGPAPEMSETGPSLFFKPVSCKQEQGFVWGVTSSRAGMTSYRSHVISPYKYLIPLLISTQLNTTRIIHSQTCTVCNQRPWSSPTSWLTVHWCRSHTVWTRRRHLSIYLMVLHLQGEIQSTRHQQTGDTVTNLII